MIVTCPGCSSNYRVRNESVPDGGAKMRCPKCQTMFLAVAPPGSEGPPSPEPPAVSMTPEPISGIFDLSTLRAPTPGDDIPFASTRPSGAMPKLAPPQLSSFPPTKIPPSVLPPNVLQPAAPQPSLPSSTPTSPPSSWSPPPTTPTGFAGQGPGPSNPFLPSGAPASASWGTPATPLSQIPGAQHSGAPTSGAYQTSAPPSSTAGLSLNELAASMQGRTPSLQPPYASPHGAANASSFAGPFTTPPPTSPFSGSLTPSQPTPFSTTTPLPPRHPQGSGARTSSLVGVLGSDLFPSQGRDGPTLPPSEPQAPRSAPLASPLRSDAPSTSVDPFAAISSGPDLRAAMSAVGPTGATPHEGVRHDAVRERPTSAVRPLAEVVSAARSMPHTSYDEVNAPPPPSPFWSAFSWLALVVGLTLVIGGGAFSAWTAGIIDLDATILPVLEANAGIAPPRSYTGRDDVTVDELLRAADQAKATNDHVSEGMLLKRASVIAPLDGELQERLAGVLTTLGLKAAAR